MRKIISIAMVCILFSLSFSLRADAALEVPKNEPLQPMPADNFPNLSNNIQSGTGAEQNDFPENEVEPEVAPTQSEASANASDAQTLQPVSGESASNSLGIFLGLAIVLLSAGIAGAYYLYRRGQIEVLKK